MTPAEARDALIRTNQMIKSAVLVLQTCEPTMRQFLEESRQMDNVGHIIDPTLWKSAERQHADQILKPVYEEALKFLAVYEDKVRELTVLDIVPDVH